MEEDGHESDPPPFFSFFKYPLIGLKKSLLSNLLDQTTFWKNSSSIPPKLPHPLAQNS